MPHQSVNEARRIADLFGDGVFAYETRSAISADSLLPQEQQFLIRAAPKRVREFAAGRVCARAALARLGYGGVALPIGADRAPSWPPGATGSITHTDGFCAAVAAPTSTLRALGLDAEPAHSVKPHLWKRICTAEELAALHLQEESAAVSAATLIFSAKEAFYKCQHTLTAEWLGFTDICIRLEEDRFAVHATRALQIAQLLPGPWYGRFLRVDDLVITAVCIA